MDTSLSHIFVPDAHLGIAGRDWRYAMVEAVVREATRHQAELCFLGDTFDASRYCTADGSKMRLRKFPGLINALQEHSKNGYAIHWIPGNHDGDFNAGSWQEWVGVEGVQVHKKLAFFEKDGICAHHGHMFDYTNTKPQPKDLVTTLEAQVAQHPHLPLAKQVEKLEELISTNEDLVNAVESWHRKNMIGVWALMEILSILERKWKNLPQGSVDDRTTDLQEHFFCGSVIKSNEEKLQQLAQLFQALETSPGPEQEQNLRKKIALVQKKLWANALQRETLVAEMCGRLFDAKAVISGHTHARFMHVTKYFNTTGNQVKNVVVANAGDIYSNAHLWNPHLHGPAYVALDRSRTMHMIHGDVSTQTWDIEKSIPLPQNTTYFSIPQLQVQSKET